MNYDKPDFYLVTPRIPLQAPGLPNDVSELTKLAEDLGYDRAWIIETNDRDAFSLATQMVLATKHIKIGTNIVSVFTRTPTLLAMGAFTLDEFSGHRFILGVGPGGTQIVSHGHGLKFEKPVKRVNESIDIIRRLVSGERLSYDGKIFNVQRDFRLRIGSEKPEAIKLYISAINPRMLQLAGEKADGVILTHAPLEAVDDVKRNIEIGAARGGRDPADVHLTANEPLGVDEPEAIMNLRRAVAWHLSSETFDWFISHTSHKATVENVRKLWWSGRRDEGAAMISDDMLLTFGLGYRDSDIKSRIRKYLAAGVTPILDGHGIRKGHEKEDTIHIMKLGISN